MRTRANFESVSASSWEGFSTKSSLGNALHVCEFCQTRWRSSKSAARRALQTNAARSLANQHCVWDEADQYDSPAPRVRVGHKKSSGMSGAGALLIFGQSRRIYVPTTRFEFQAGDVSNFDKVARFILPNRQQNELLAKNVENDVLFVQHDALQPEW